MISQSKEILEEKTPFSPLYNTTSSDGNIAQHGHLGQRGRQLQALYRQGGYQENPKRHHV